MPLFAAIFSSALNMLSSQGPDAADDSLRIEVHFLYGSRPKKEFRDSERKWFGGKLGGHVGIEVEPGKVIDFVRRGEFHWFAKKKEKHSRFATRSTQAFWEIFRAPAATVKQASIGIPISIRQKSILDSLVGTYTSETPYDYAFVGMRCGSATYDVLAQLGILKRYSYRKTYRKIFYPKKLRKRLLKRADAHGWTVRRQDGSPTRKWERD